MKREEKALVSGPELVGQAGMERVMERREETTAVFLFSFFFICFVFVFLSFWSSNDRVVCPFLPAFPRSELRLPSCYRHYEGLHKRETGGGRLKAGQWKRQYLSFSAVLDWAVLFSLAECDWITHQPPVKMATVSA